MRNEISKSMFRFTLALLPVGVAVLLTGYVSPPTALKQIIDDGELVVATRVGPTTYFMNPQGPAGFEYDLASLFADHLGVDLKIVASEDLNDILPMVTRREVHFAAAGLSITGPHLQNVRFGPPYQEVTQQLVYRNGTSSPSALDDLMEEVIEIASGSGHAEQMRKLKIKHPYINWREHQQTGIEDLLAQVWRREIFYTVANSNDVKINQRYYPELRIAFDLNEPEALAWTFPKSRDNSLINAARTFFSLIEENGQLEQLRERYYGHVREFDYVETRRFLRHVDQRLPKYLEMFRAAAKRHDHDWRLLAAMGYQESHWNPGAISPTGVRGIMMLTRRTAADLGIQNRIDPGNSIRGGAHYLEIIRQRLSKEIPEPDRSWLALAAYNIGLGHLEDAREITRKRGGDSNKWMDIKESLPLLMEKEWYEETRYGYARGTEAVQYVQNIRSYYDILLWQTTAQKTDTAPPITVSTRSLLTEQSYIPSPVL